MDASTTEAASSNTCAHLHHRHDRPSPSGVRADAAGGAGWAGGQFDLHYAGDTMGGMIAVAKDFDVAREMMTVQQVMDAIGARAPSTITRLIKAKRLRAAKVGAMGWLVYRDSVTELLEAERRAGPTVGFPRGGIRSKNADAKPAKAAKAAKPAKKANRG